MVRTLVSILALGLLVSGCGVLFETVQDGTPSEADARLAPDATAQRDGGGPEADVGAEDRAPAVPGPTGPWAEEVGDDAAAVPEAAVAADAEGAPLHGDMLSAAEARDAVEVALRSAPVSELVASSTDRDSPPVQNTAAGRQAPELRSLTALAGQPSHRVVYVQRWADKAAGAAQGRAAEVLVYRYDTASAMLVRVDLAGGRSEVVETARAAIVPVTPAEIAEAAVVARAAPAVRQALSAAGLDEDAPATALLTVGAQPDARCSRHRCLRVFFSSLRAPTPEFAVVVDMADLEVVEVEPMPDGRGQP
jgi:hypothetical protein